MSVLRILFPQWNLNLSGKAIFSQMLFSLLNFLAFSIYRQEEQSKNKKLKLFQDEQGACHAGCPKRITSKQPSSTKGK